MLSPLKGAIVFYLRVVWRETSPACRFSETMSVKSFELDCESRRTKDEQDTKYLACRSVELRSPILKRISETK